MKIDPNRELTATVNEHCIKLTLHDLLLQLEVHCSALTKQDSFCSRWQHRGPQLIGMQRIRDQGFQPQMGHLNHILSREIFRGHCVRGTEKTVRVGDGYKEMVFTDTTGNMHTGTHSVCDIMQKTHTSSSQRKFQH